jgi:hypothetical protein
VDYFDFFVLFPLLPGSITNTHSWLNPFTEYPHSRFCHSIVHRVNKETHLKVQNLNPTYYLPYAVMAHLDTSVFSYAAWGHDRCASKHTHTHFSKAWTHKLLVCKLKKMFNDLFLLSGGKLYIIYSSSSYYYYYYYYYY